MSQQPHSPLYRMTAFGLRNPWVIWSIQRGGLDGWCVECRGTGYTLRSPCANREPSPVVEVVCRPPEGCADCRCVCFSCRGTRLAPDDSVRAEDFGDEESLERALAMFPDLAARIESRKRMDMNARAL